MPVKFLTDGLGMRWASYDIGLEQQVFITLWFINIDVLSYFHCIYKIRVRPIPGKSRYTDTDARDLYLYENNWCESVSVSVSV